MGFMSWLRNDDLFQEQQEMVTRAFDELSQLPNEPIVDDVLLKALIEGETIDREKAMSLPAVNAAVDLIANMIACMPVKLYKYKKGKVEEVEKDTRVQLLNIDTGDTLDPFQMKKAMVIDYLMGQGGYCYINRNGNDVISLNYVEDIHVTVVNNYKPIFKDYEILVEGETYKPYQFLKILRNTKDGSKGIGATEEVSKAIETAYNTILFQLGMVQTGGNKKGFLKSQRKLGQEEMNALKKAWNDMYSNKKTENVVLLNNGLEFQEANTTAVESQLNESKQTLEREINDIFHIKDDFYETFKLAIYPIMKAFETTLNRELLLENEKGKYFFGFDVKEIIKANIQERFNAYKTAKETGWLSLNEIREEENREYIEGLDVVNVGLGAVLFDFNTHSFYTPNTNTQATINSTDDNIEKVIEDKEIDTAFEQSGNSSDG